MQNLLVKDTFDSFLICSGEIITGSSFSFDGHINKAFFDKVFKEIGDMDRDTVLIVGDSLTSDIRGGNNAGIRTCWYNPEHAALIEGVHVDYEITDLHEVYDLLKK